MRISAAIVFIIVFQTSLSELVAIPTEFALNVPFDLRCDFYSAWRRFGCFDDDMRYFQLPIVIVLGTAFLIYLSKLELGKIPYRIIAIVVLILFALASIVRTIYFLQGHASTTYLVWTIPLALTAAGIWYWLMKHPWDDKNPLNAGLIEPVEQERLELEIEERKRERDGSI